jgi:hypothetical protein
MALLQAALVSIPPHKFVRLPCWYYRLSEIEKYDFRAVPNGITSTQNFIQIRPTVIEFSNADRDKHDQPCLRSFDAHRAKNA